MSSLPPNVNLRFQARLTPERSAELWQALGKLITTRACRTCDYGDSPDCDHDQRAQRVCASTASGIDCPITPCLGGCKLPGRPQMGA